MYWTDYIRNTHAPGTEPWTEGAMNMQIQSKYDHVNLHDTNITDASINPIKLMMSYSTNPDLY